MADIRLQRLAQVLVHYSLGIKKGDRCIKNTLFDEKMGGTVHLALGASIPETGGVNQSALHWDMVCDLRTGVKSGWMANCSPKMVSL